MIYNDKYEESKQKLYENRIQYSLPCRLGLWNEDLAIQEHNNNIRAYKRDHCQLLVQKTKKMMRNVLKPMALAVEIVYVVFGENYQIKTSDLTNKLTFATSPEGLYLSAVITEKEIHTCHHFKHGCMLTASPINDAFLRNTFIFVGCNREAPGDHVAYGQDIFIQIAGNEGPPLYVQCENTTMDTFGNHLSLRLSSVPDFYCRFKVLHWDPQKRFVTTGATCSPDTRIVIQHIASGQNLAVEATSWVLTLFGPECNVTCHTYRDSHKMETAENFWMLMGQPKIDTNLFAQAAKPVGEESL